jgi:arylsulfatase A-like enzyme
MIIGNPQEDARLIMICDARWKYVHCEGFRPMLFDLQGDPQELVDLGASPDHSDVRQRMHDAISEWSRKHHNRITLTPERIEQMTGREPPGILIGIWDEEQFEDTFGKPFQERS